MVQVALFIIIVIVALFAGWIYYRAIASPARKTHTGTTAPDIQPIVAGREAVIESAPGKSTDLEYREEELELLKPVDDEIGIKHDFLPEEEGIYHKMDRLTERGWSDLNYTLVMLSRLPSETAELLKILNDPDSDASMVAGICERSVELTARILKLINSPFYGLNSPIDNIQHAVALMGFNEVRMIILTSGLFQKEAVTPGLIDINELWKHSLATARITSWIADKTGIQVRKALVGTGAMLHDVGKLVLQRWRPEAFKKALTNSREMKTSLTTEELKVLGVSHALAGNLLLKRWRLPLSLLWVVKGCHLPVINEELPELATVYLAGQIARYIAIGADGELVDEKIPNDIRELLEIPVETLPDLLDDDFKEYATNILADLQGGVAV